MSSTGATLSRQPLAAVSMHLVLSMLAAIQGPIIMMSQDLQAAKDRLRARMLERLVEEARGATPPRPVTPTTDPMDTTPIAEPLARLLAELTDGPGEGPAYMLNPRDPGLHASLDRLDAAAASATRDGGASIAAHADHVRYGLSLMNRWAEGEENPFATADWSASWRRGTVDEDGWARLRAELRDQADRWRRALATPRQANAVEVAGMISSVAHLAYHLGAIRQIDRAARGPAEGTQDSGG